MKFNRQNCGMKKCTCGMMVMGGDKGWRTHHGLGGSHRKRVMRLAGYGRTLAGRGRRGRKKTSRGGKHGRKRK